MLPFLLGAAGTAASLYSFMNAVEQGSKTLDQYIDDNVDIITQSPVLGRPEMICICRSKSERRLLESYNQLLLSYVDQINGTSLLFDWDKPGFKFDKASLTLIMRLGAAFHNWWKEGFTGQYLANNPTIDPKVSAIFRLLEDSDKAVIARAQALISSAAKRYKK